MFETAWAYGRRTLERRPYTWLAALYALCVLVFVATIPLPRVDSQLVGSDGVYYYSYLPALLLEGNLDFAGTYARLLGPDVVARMQLTPTGLLPNPYAIGPALLWSPFFLAGHALSGALQAAGFPIMLDGTGYLYQGATLVGSISYGFAGLLLVHRSCRRFFDRATSTLVAVLMWTATSVVYYMVAEPSMSHTASLFAAALFVELWLASRPTPTLRRWAVIGLAGGLVALVRLPDATFLALPVLDGLLASADARSSVRRLLARVFAFGLGAIVVFAPQMAVWQVLYGSPFTSGYLYTDQPTFFWLAPKVPEVLFSPLHGLFTWHPLLFFAAIGLGFLYRRDRRLALLVVAGLAMQVYVIGAWRDWGQGDAFGGRMFISSIPGLALGLGALIEWVVGRGYLSAIGTISTLLVAWNGVFLVQYRLGYIPMNAPLTLEQFTVGKVAMLFDLVRRFTSRMGP